MEGSFVQQINPFRSVSGSTTTNGKSISIDTVENHGIKQKKKRASPKKKRTILVVKKKPARKVKKKKKKTVTGRRKGKFGIFS